MKVPRLPIRAGRRTNLALAVLVPVALATGLLAWAYGTAWSRWAIVAHGAAGLGLLVLAPWKSVIVRRGLRRNRPGSGLSMWLTALIGVSIAAGLAHATGILRSAGPITAMQIHVAAAVAALPLFAWHLRARPARPRPVDLSRRVFLRSALVGAGSVAAYGAFAGMVHLTGLPGRKARFTGSFPIGPHAPEAMPVTQWLFDTVPSVDAATWRLGVRDRGSNVATLSLGQLDSMGEEVEAVLDCTGGWFSPQRWRGVRLDRLLPGRPVGASIEVRSATGYSRRYPLGDASRLWLATRVGGAPLSEGHGAPARLVAPGRRGYWWVKWVRAVEVSDVPWWWQAPFPVH
jgi:DMSO/TMAO reductase YedYZ molybdopterin-dependent catalytic subunit